MEHTSWGIVDDLLVLVFFILAGGCNLCGKSECIRQQGSDGGGWTFMDFLLFLGSGRAVV